MSNVDFTKYLLGETGEWVFRTNLKTNQKGPSLPQAELLPDGLMGSMFPHIGLCPHAGFKCLFLSNRSVLQIYTPTQALAQESW